MTIYIIIGIVIGIFLVLIYQYFMKKSPPVLEPDTVHVFGEANKTQIKSSLREMKEIKENGEESRYFAQSRFILDPKNNFTGTIYNDTDIPLYIRISPEYL